MTATPAFLEIVKENDALRELLAQALEDSIHAPSCAYLHHDVDAHDVGKCNCWKGRAAKLLGKPTPPATGVKPAARAGWESNDGG